jgi:hypothetical protein
MTVSWQKVVALWQNSVCHCTVMVKLPLLSTLSAFFAAWDVANSPAGGIG